MDGRSVGNRDELEKSIRTNMGMIIGTGIGMSIMMVMGTGHEDGNMEGIEIVMGMGVRIGITKRMGKKIGIVIVTGIGTGTSIWMGIGTEILLR